MDKITVIGAGNVGATCANVLAHKNLAKNVILVDVRDGYQYISKHLPQAISLPLNTGDAQIAGFLALPKDELIFIY